MRSNRNLTVIGPPTTHKHHKTPDFSAVKGYNESVSYPNINYRFIHHICISISVSSSAPVDFVISYTQSLTMVQCYVCTHGYVVVTPYVLPYEYLSHHFTTYRSVKILNSHILLIIQEPRNLHKSSLEDL